MKNLGIKTAEVFADNQLFNPHHRINSDGLLDPWIVFKKKCEQKGIECQTLDVFQRESRMPSDVIFLDVPKLSASSYLGRQSVRKHLILQECEVVIRRNWQTKRHLEFDKIFTWNPDLADRKKYFHLNPAQSLQSTSIDFPFSQRKLCHIIAGNKISFHPQELYSERVKVIRFFEANHSMDFDLYGVGWDAFPSSQFYFRILNRFDFLKRAVPKYPSYQGKVATKREVMSRYKFSVCLENAFGFKGYITEKVFDCLKNGVVPIYKGAPNIHEVLPKECFVAYDQFKTLEEMWQFMTSFTESDYKMFLTAAKQFLVSKKAEEYSSQHFADVLFHEIVEQ